MNISDYLARIGVESSARADFPTLRAMQRAHVHAVPFENLDVQLRRPVTLETEAIYDKVVRRKRGGWCYELNGLMGWALEQLGFEVTRVSAGVAREISGDGQLGNHLCLLVHLERPYLVDVGFGSSLLEPLPLEVGERIDAPYRVGLAEVGDGYWRFSERAHGAPFGFDFKPTHADEALLAAKSRLMQTDAGSPFVQNMVAKRRLGDAYFTLRGRVLTRTDVTGDTKTVLDSAAECVRRLRELFDLDVPEVEALWPAICARHEALFERARES